MQASKSTGVPAGVQNSSDSLHFSGKRYDKLKQKWPAIKAAGAAYGLSLSLGAAGIATTTVGIVNANSRLGDTVHITETTNINELSSPLRMNGPTPPLLNKKEKVELPPAESVIESDAAMDYARKGLVSEVSPTANGLYTLKLNSEGQQSTVTSNLSAEQYKEVVVLAAFGPETPEKPKMPTTSQITPQQARGYSQAGMLLAIRPNVESEISDVGTFHVQPTGTHSYYLTVTDGKLRATHSVNLTDEQHRLITQIVKEKPAVHSRMYQTKGEATGADLFLIFDGLGLGAIASFLGRRKYVQRSVGNNGASGVPALAGGGSPPRALPTGFIKPSKSLEDIAGLSRQTKEDLDELLEVLSTEQEDMDASGMEPVQGVLLYGPPGTGKTELAEAIASKTNRIYKRISAAELGTNMYKGTGVAKVKKEFEEVRAAAEAGHRVLLQLDEADGLFTDREKAHDEDAQTLNQFLTEVDNLVKDPQQRYRNVVVVYTTNHLKKMDSAAIRNGRVDYKIKVPLPATTEQRREILDVYVRKPKPKLLAEDVDLNIIAEKCQGFSGSDIKALMKKAVVRARRNEHTAITQADLLESLEMIDRQRKKSAIGNLSSVERPKTTFNDLGGLDEIVPQFRDIAARLSKMAENRHDNTAPSDEEEPLKPILLEGDSGTGKTELGRALANEAKCNFMYVNGSEFEDGIIGHGAANVRKLFEDGRENAPTIIFIDEGDAAFAKRSNGGNRNEEREATLNQLLTEINGLKPNDGVFVMSATNRADIFDTAAISRFESISVPKPSHPRQRRQILDVHVRKRSLAPDVNLDTIAQDTAGYSGRDLKSLIQLAARQARRAGRQEITQEDFDNAIDIHELGEKSVYPGSEEDLRLVAKHEVGHGIATMTLKRRWPEVKVRAVTMEARRPKGGGQVLGFVRPHFPEGIAYNNIAIFLAQILVYASGRSTERVLLGEGADTAGGGSDYQQIEQIVIRMLQSGMIPGFGPNHFAKSKQQLTPDERQVVDYIIGQAEAASELLISSAEQNHPGLMDRLAQDCIEAKTVRNAQAEALFTNVLSEKEDWEPLCNIVDSYISTVIQTLNAKAKVKQQQFAQEVPNELMQQAAYRHLPQSIVKG